MSTVKSTSSRVVSSEIVSLTEPCAISCGSPIARRTCEGSSEPEVHADPLEPHIFFWSSIISNDSPSINLVVDKEDPKDNIADQISNDVNNILDVDVLIDKLDDIEDDSAEYIDVHVKNTPLRAEVKSDNEIYLKVHKVSVR